MFDHRKMLFEKDWWMTDYAADIVDIMRQQEKKINKFMSRSPQLESRHLLVDLLTFIGENLDLRMATIHLSVHLMDYFMDNHDVLFSHLKLLSTSCLLLAAKFEDQDCAVPRVCELNCMMQTNEFTAKHYMEMELILLKFFDWNIMVPTVPHFVDYFATEAITCYDLRVDQPVVRNITKELVWYYIKYFMDISLQDVVFLRYPRSLVAAACIASMRLSLMLSPKWTMNLQKITRYTWEQLQSCIEIMIRALEMDEEMSQRKRKTSMDSQEIEEQKLAIKSTDSPIKSMSEVVR